MMSKFAMVLLLLSLTVAGQDVFLFTSFRGNGESGVSLAISRDGKQWTSLNENRPWVHPEHPMMLMRDPRLSQGPATQAITTASTAYESATGRPSRQ